MGGGESDYGAGGVVAIVQGLRDAGLAITFVRRAHLINCLRKRRQVPTTVETSTECKKQNTSTQMCDGNYTTSYQLAHCHLTPNLPSHQLPEFPPQTVIPSRSKGNFRIGHGPREGMYTTGPKTTLKGPSFRYSRGSLVSGRLSRTDAFIRSLRRYPLSPEGSVSSELVQRLLNYTQAKHLARDTLRRVRSHQIKSLHQALDKNPCQSKDKSASERRDNMKSTDRSPTQNSDQSTHEPRDNSPLVTNKSPLISRQLHPILSRGRSPYQPRDKNQRLQPKDNSSLQYSDQNSDNSPYHFENNRSFQFTESNSPYRSVAKTSLRLRDSSTYQSKGKSLFQSRDRSPVQSRDNSPNKRKLDQQFIDKSLIQSRNFKLRKNHAKASKFIQTYTRLINDSLMTNFESFRDFQKRSQQDTRYDKNQLDDTYNYLKATYSEGLSYSGRGPEVRYINEVKRCIRDAFKQIVEDTPVPCPRFQERKSLHIKSCHSGRNSLPRKRSSEGPEEFPSTSKCGPSFVCPYKLPRQYVCPFKRPPCIPKPPCSPCPCPKRISKTVYNKIEDVTEEWLREIPVYENDTTKNKTDRQKLVKELADTLKTLIGRKDFMEKAEEEIEKCIDHLNMWYPGDKHDKEKLKKQIANNLCNKLLTVVVNTDPNDLNGVIAKWLSHFHLVDSQGNTVNTEELVEKVVNRLKPIIHKPELRDEINDILKELQVQNDLNEICNNLVNELKKVKSVKDNTPTFSDENELKQHIWDWLDMVSNAPDDTKNNNRDLIEKLAHNLKSLESDNIKIDLLKREIQDFLDLLHKRGIHIDSENENILLKSLLDKTKPKQRKKWRQDLDVQNLVADGTSELSDDISIDGYGYDDQSDIKEKTAYAFSQYIEKMSKDDDIKQEIINILTKATEIPEDDVSEFVSTLINKVKDMPISPSPIFRQPTITAAEMRDIVEEEVNHILEYIDLPADDRNAIVQRITGVLADQIILGTDNDKAKQEIIDILRAANVPNDDITDVCHRIMEKNGEMSLSYRSLDSALILHNAAHNKYNSELNPLDKSELKKNAEQEILNFIEDLNKDGSLSEKNDRKEAAAQLAEKLATIILDPRDVNKDDNIMHEVSKYIKKIPFTNEESREKLAKQLKRRLQNMNPQTSTPNKKSFFSSPKTNFNNLSDIKNDSLSATQLQIDKDENYKNELISTVKSWIHDMYSKLKIPEYQAFKGDLFKEAVEKLAEDIKDRQRYLQIHPEVRRSDENELEHLKYQVFRRLSKVPGAYEIMSEIMLHTNALMDKANEVSSPQQVKYTKNKSISAPPTKTPISEAVSNILSKHISLSRINSLEQLECEFLKQVLISRINELQQSDPTNKSKLRKEIHKYIKKLPFEINKSKENDLEKQLTKYLVATAPVDTKVSLDDCIRDAVIEWINSLVLKNIFTLKDVRSEDKEELILALADSLVYASKVPFNSVDEIERAIAHFIKKIPINTYKTPSNKVLAVDLLKMLEKYFVSSNAVKEKASKTQDSKTSATGENEFISEPYGKVDNIEGKTSIEDLNDHSIFDNISEHSDYQIFRRSSNLSDVSDISSMMPKTKMIEKAKRGPIPQLSQSKNKNFNHEHTHGNEMDNNMSNLSHKNIKVKRQLPHINKDLIEKTKKSKQRTRDEYEKQTDNQSLIHDSIANTMASQELSIGKQPSLNVLKDDLAESGSKWNNSGNYEKQRNTMPREIEHEIYKFCTRYSKKHPESPINPVQLQQYLLNALDSISEPTYGTINKGTNSLKNHGTMQSLTQNVPSKEQAGAGKIQTNKRISFFDDLQNIEKKQEIFSNRMNNDEGEMKRKTNVINKTPLNTNADKDYSRRLSASTQQSTLSTQEKCLNNILDNVFNWVDSLSILAVTPKQKENAKNLKHHIATNLCEQLSELNMNAGVFNDDYLYKNMLSNKFDDILLRYSDLDSNLRLQLPTIKENLITKIIKARKKTIDDNSGLVTEQQICDDYSRRLSASTQHSTHSTQEKCLNNILDNVLNWVDSLSIPAVTPKQKENAENLKHHIATNLCEQLSELNMNAGVFNDDYLYKNMLSNKFDDILLRYSDLDSNLRLQLPTIKENLITKIIKARKKTIDDNSGLVTEQQIRDDYSRRLSASTQHSTPSTQEKCLNNILDNVLNWVDSLSIPAVTPKQKENAENLKHHIATNLCEQLSELNMNAGVFNDDYLYKNMLSNKFDDILLGYSDLDSNLRLQLPTIKENLITKIIKARKKTIDDNLGLVTEQQICDDIFEMLPYETLSPDDKESLKFVNDKVTKALIKLNSSVCNEEERYTILTNINDEIRNYCRNYSINHPDSSINFTQLRQNIFNAFKNITEARERTRDSNLGQAHRQVLSDADSETLLDQNLSSDEKQSFKLLKDCIAKSLIKLHSVDNDKRLRNFLQTKIMNEITNYCDEYLKKHPGSSKELQKGLADVFNETTSNKTLQGSVAQGLKSLNSTDNKETQKKTLKNSVNDYTTVYSDSYSKKRSSKKNSNSEYLPKGKNNNIKTQLPSIKNNLTENTKEAKLKIQDDDLGQTYRQQILDIISEILPSQNVSIDEKASFKRLKDNIADAFINLINDASDEELKNISRKRINDEVNNFYNQYLKNKSVMSLDPKQLHQNLLNALMGISEPPKKYFIKDFDKLMKDLSFKEMSSSEKLDIKTKASVLAKNLYDIQKQKLIFPDTKNDDEKVKEAVTKFLTSLPLKSIKDINLSEFTKKLVDNLKGKEQFVRVSDISLKDKGSSPELYAYSRFSEKPTVEKIADVLYDDIYDWSRKLPITPDSPEERENANIMKQAVASKIIKIIGELNMNPEAFNDDFLYEHLLEDEIDNLLMNLSSNDNNFRMQLPDIKKKLIKLVKDARLKSQEEYSGKVYKQHLREAISDTLPSQELSIDEEASFDVLKDNLADAFINLHYVGSDENLKSRLGNKIKDEINKFCNNYLKKHPETPIDAKVLNRDLYNALTNVSVPKPQPFKKEVELVKIKDEINDWRRDLPMISKSGVEQLRLNKMVSVLATKLHAIEKEKESNPHTKNSDDKMFTEIIKFMEKLPITENQNIKMFASKLVNNLKETENIRRVSASTRHSVDSDTFLSLTKNSSCCCSHHVAWIPQSSLSADDRTYLQKIKARTERSKMRSSTSPTQDVSISPLPVNASCQTETEKPIAMTNCEQDESNPYKCIKGPHQRTQAIRNHADVQPNVVIKEYHWVSPKSSMAMPNETSCANSSAFTAPNGPLACESIPEETLFERTKAQQSSQCSMSPCQFSCGLKPPLNLTRRTLPCSRFTGQSAYPEDLLQRLAGQGNVADGRQSSFPHQFLYSDSMCEKNATQAARKQKSQYAKRTESTSRVCPKPCLPRLARGQGYNTPQRSMPQARPCGSRICNPYLSTTRRTSQKENDAPLITSEIEPGPSLRKPRVTRIGTTDHMGTRVCKSRSDCRKNLEVCNRDKISRSVAPYDNVRPCSGKEIKEDDVKCSCKDKFLTECREQMPTGFRVANDVIKKCPKCCGVHCPYPSKMFFKQ